MSYNPMAFSIGTIAGAIEQNRSQFGNTVMQYEQLGPWLGRAVNAVNPITIPLQPGIQATNLDGPKPNADDMERKLAEAHNRRGEAIATRTNNLVTCPNADGEIPLSCWLFSSENDTFFRKSLHDATTPGTEDVSEIMVGPANWLEMQNNGTNESSWALVNDQLYNTEQLDSEQRIFTGVMVNSNTGEMYETYEDDVPPPDTDKHRIMPQQLTIQNPILTALSGGYDPSMPPRHKVEVPQGEGDYGPDAGHNVWGSQLYATAIRDLQEQLDVRAQFNNRDGFEPIEKAMDRRAVGFVGHVCAYRGAPFMPGTQREAYGSSYAVNESLRNIHGEYMDIPVYRDLSDVDPHRKSPNREAPRVVQGATLSEANQAPGRMAFATSTSEGVSPMGQIYSDGHIELKTEAPVSTYIQAQMPPATMDLVVPPAEYGAPKRFDTQDDVHLFMDNVYQQINQPRITTGARAVRKTESLGLGNMQQFSPTALAGIADGPAQYLNSPSWVNSVRLVADVSEVNASRYGFPKLDAVHGFRDGSELTHQEYLDTVHLKEDVTREQQLRSLAVLNANEQVGGGTRHYLSPEQTYQSRTSQAGGALEGSGPGQRVHDHRASANYDRSQASEYAAPPSALSDAWRTASNTADVYMNNSRKERGGAEIGYRVNQANGSNTQRFVGQERDYDGRDYQLQRSLVASMG